MRGTPSTSTISTALASSCLSLVKVQQLSTLCEKLFLRKTMTRNENTEAGCSHYLESFKRICRLLKLDLGYMDKQCNWIRQDHLSNVKTSSVSWATHLGKIQKNRGSLEKGLAIIQVWAIFDWIPFVAAGRDPWQRTSKALNKCYLQVWRTKKASNSSKNHNRKHSQDPHQHNCSRTAS